MRLTKQDQQYAEAIHNVHNAFISGGFDVDGNTVTIRDSLGQPDAHLVFNRVITEIIQTTIEPTLIGHMLLETIYTSETGTSEITLRTLGNITGIDFDIPESGEYPEITPGVTQGSIVKAHYSKSGLKLRINEELLAASQWNLIEQIIRQASQALARWKERKIFNMLSRVGHVAFDNVDPNKSEFGRTTGRDIHGIANGSMTQDNLIDMYGSLLTKGYIPNVILVHPMMWAMFAKDPIIREAGMVKGDISQWLTSQVTPINPYQKIRPWTDATRRGNYDRQDVTQRESDILHSEGANSRYNIPSYSPLSGMTIIPSHYMPFDAVKKTSTIVMMDTTKAGAVIVNETLKLQEWDNLENDMKTIKLREKYALALYDQGRAVVLAKNISTQPNEIFNNPSIQLDGGKITPIKQKD